TITQLEDFIPVIRRGATVYRFGPPLLDNYYQTVVNTLTGVPSYQFALRIPFIIWDPTASGTVAPRDIVLADDGAIIRKRTDADFTLATLQPVVGVDGSGPIVTPLQDNPCDNPDAPSFPGFMPVVTFPNDDPTQTPQLSCPPAAGFSGTVQPVNYDVQQMATVGEPDSSLALLRRRVNFQKFCDNEFPPPGLSNALSNAQPPAVCYRGSVGQEAFALRTLASEIAIANEEAGSLIREYDLQIQSCTILRAANTEREGLTAAHTETMNSLQNSKTALEITAAIADRTADCADSIGGAMGVRGGIAAGVSCGARALAAATESAAIGIGFEMDRAQRAHDLAVLNIENSAEEDRCFTEAEISLVGLEAARIRVQRAVDELTLGYLKFEESVAGLDLLVNNGIEDIAAARASTASVAGRDPWLNDDVRTFHRTFALARRAAYLGVRAVEYEFQQSLTARGLVLAAEKPDELVQVLEELRSIKVTGSINGAQPAELTEVL
ncbi:MAG: hypothetical protein AAFY60_14065, partial [Myxococcota bacterium]